MKLRGMYEVVDTVMIIAGLINDSDHVEPRELSMMPSSNYAVKRGRSDSSKSFGGTSNLTKRAKYTNLISEAPSEGSYLPVMPSRVKVTMTHADVNTWNITMKQAVRSKISVPSFRR